jgi:cobalt/nickel transport protein
MKTTTKLWIGVAVLAVLSPIGLYLPHAFKAGPAWGEWNADTTKGLVGYAPAGLKKLSTVWHALLPGYAFNGAEQAGSKYIGFAYIISAVVGIALIAGVAFLIGKLLAKKENNTPRKPV